MKRRSLIFTAVLAAAAALIALPFAPLFASGILIGALVATVIFGLLAKVFRAAVARKKASSGHLVLFIAVKVLIVAAGLSVAILVGRPAVIGLFVGVTVALAGTVGAGIKED